MTDQPTLHTCARCGVADEDVISWTSGKRTAHEHLTPDLCAIAKLQRQSARRLELLRECVADVRLRIANLNRCIADARTAESQREAFKAALAMQEERLRRINAELK